MTIVAILERFRRSLDHRLFQFRNRRIHRGTQGFRKLIHGNTQFCRCSANARQCRLWNVADNMKLTSVRLRLYGDGQFAQSECRSNPLAASPRQSSYHQESSLKRLAHLFRYDIWLNHVTEPPQAIQKSQQYFVNEPITQLKRFQGYPNLPTLTRGSLSAYLGLKYRKFLTLRPRWREIHRFQL